MSYGISCRTVLRFRTDTTPTVARLTSGQAGCCSRKSKKVKSKRVKREKSKKVKEGVSKLNQCGLKAQHHIAQGSALGILYS